MIMHQYGTMFSEKVWLDMKKLLMQFFLTLQNSQVTEVRFVSA